MTEMLDRAAKAAHEALSRANVIAYLEMPDNTANVVARAVIEAMREPTYLMEQEGWRQYNRGPCVKPIWQHMIDAATAQARHRDEQA